MLTYKKIAERVGITPPGARLLVKTSINKLYYKLIKKEKLSPLEAFISLTSFLKINNEMDLSNLFDLFEIEVKREIIKNGKNSRICSGTEGYFNYKNGYGLAWKSEGYTMY
jgi:hypothetical protein